MSKRVTDAWSFTQQQKRVTNAQQLGKINKAEEERSRKERRKPPDCRHGMY